MIDFIINRLTRLLHGYGWVALAAVFLMISWSSTGLAVFSSTGANDLRSTCKFDDAPYGYLVIEDVNETLVTGSLVGGRSFTTTGVESINISENEYITANYSSWKSSVDFVLIKSLKSILINSTKSTLELKYNLSCRGRIESQQGQVQLDIQDENNIAPEFELSEYEFDVNWQNYEASKGGFALPGLTVFDGDYMPENAQVKINLTCTFATCCAALLKVAVELNNLDLIGEGDEENSEIEAVDKKAGFHYTVVVNLLTGLPVLPPSSPIIFGLTSTDGVNSRETKVKIRFVKQVELKDIAVIEDQKPVPWDWIVGIESCMLVVAIVCIIYMCRHRQLVVCVSEARSYTPININPDRENEASQETML